MDRLTGSSVATRLLLTVSRATVWVPDKVIGDAENPSGGSFKASLMGLVNPSLRMAWMLTAPVDLLRRLMLEGTTHSSKMGRQSL